MVSSETFADFELVMILSRRKKVDGIPMDKDLPNAAVNSYEKIVFELEEIIEQRAHKREALERSRPLVEKIIAVLLENVHLLMKWLDRRCKALEKHKKDIFLTWLFVLYPFFVSVVTAFLFENSLFFLITGLFIGPAAIIWLSKKIIYGLFDEPLPGGTIVTGCLAVLWGTAVMENFWYPVLLLMAWHFLVAIFQTIRFCLKYDPHGS